MITLKRRRSFLITFLITFLISHYSFQIYNFRFQINVEASGATDVTKYLKLSKITNFLWRGPEATQKLFFFSQFSLAVNNFRVFTKCGRRGYFVCWETFTQKWYLQNKKNLQKLRQNIVYSVKCILRCFTTKCIQKHIQD